MASWSKILELAPRFLLGLVPGLVGGVGGGFAGSVARGALGKAGKPGLVFDYPKLTDDFWYDVDNVKNAQVTSIGGKQTVLPAMNGSTMDRATINAALAQSLQEHNRAVERGNERDLEEWWPGEDKKPRRTLHPKSTAIDGIRITKGGNIQIKWLGGKSKWYTYRGGDDIRQTTEFVKDLMTAPSIGRALVREGKYAWPNSRHLDGEGKVNNSIKQMDGNVGFWGRAHYADDWASLG